MKSFICHESYYNCECGSEVILVRQYNFEGTPDPQVELAIYRNCPLVKGWKEQLRWIWNIILNKEIWSDQIILNKEEMERLGNQLLSLAKDIE